MVVKVGEIWGSFTQKEPYIYAKRVLSELPGATLAAPVISWQLLRCWATSRIGKLLLALGRAYDPWDHEPKNTVCFHVPTYGGPEC